MNPTFNPDDRVICIDDRSPYGGLSIKKGRVYTVLSCRNGWNDHKTLKLKELLVKYKDHGYHSYRFKLVPHIQVNEELFDL